MTSIKQADRQILFCKIVVRSAQKGAPFRYRGLVVTFGHVGERLRILFFVGGGDLVAEVSWLSPLYDLALSRLPIRRQSIATQDLSTAFSSEFVVAWVSDSKCRLPATNLPSLAVHLLP